MKLPRSSHRRITMKTIIAAIFLSLLLLSLIVYADAWIRDTGPNGGVCYPTMELAEDATNSYAAKQEAKARCSGEITKFNGKPSCKQCKSGGYICATYYEAYCKE